MARRERRAFGPKALYEPNRTGRFMISTVLIVCVWISVVHVRNRGKARAPSVRTESPVRTELQCTGPFSTVLISHCQFQFPNAGVKRTLFMIGLVAHVQVIIQ